MIYMNYWIFQATPQRYDLRVKFVEGQTVTWYATRYRSPMEPGDIVFFWLAGPSNIKGIYGWGRLTGSPYPKPEWESYGVDVKYEKRLESPIPYQIIDTDPSFKQLMIKRAPQATNFLVSDEEAKALIDLMKPSERPGAA